LARFVRLAEAKTAAFGFQPKDQVAAPESANRGAYDQESSVSEFDNRNAPLGLIPRRVVCTRTTRARRARMVQWQLEPRPCGILLAALGLFSPANLLDDERR
jgi:hypothetical protein